MPCFFLSNSCQKILDLYKLHNKKRILCCHKTGSVANPCTTMLSMWQSSIYPLLKTQNVFLIKTGEEREAKGGI